MQPVWELQTEPGEDGSLRGVGTHDVPKNSQAHVDRLLSDVEEPTHPTPEWQRPFLTRAGIPVCCNGRVGEEKPATIEVVVHEGLKQELIDIGSVIITGKGPQLSGQNANRPGFHLREDHRSWARTPFS